MASKDENIMPPKRRGPGGMRGPGVPGEKAKDFKGSILRLLKEIRKYKILIILALVLAISSAVLAIMGPDKLSAFVDEISNGLVINQDNMQELTTIITENITEDKIKDKMSEILDLNISQEKIVEIMSSENINAQDKMSFQDSMTKMAQSNSNEDIVSYIIQLPDSILSVILPDTEYKGNIIATQDKVELLKMFEKLTEDTSTIDIPDSLIPVFFEDLEFKNVIISSKDQYEYLKILTTMKDKQDVNVLYGKIDEMPESIKGLISPFMDMDAIKKIAISVALLYIFSAIFNFIQSISMTHVSNNFARDLRGRISIKINKLPLRYFDKHSTGDILSRVTNDVDTIAQSMNQSLSTLVSSITLLIGTLIMMFVTNWIMAITAILASLIGFMGMSLILSKSQKYFIARQTELGNLNGHIEEVYSGLNVVKAYNGKRQSDEVFDDLNRRVAESNRKSQFLSGLMMPLMNFIGNFGYVAVCIVGALLTMNNVISFGVIVAFITYVRLFTNPLSQMAQAMTSLQSTAAAGERVFEFLDEKEMSDQKECKKHLDKDKVKGDIEFNHIKFQYDNNPKPTIIDFTAKAKSGQKIAIVGPTGAGKTTMVNLLMKFYDLTDGDIKIDGVSTKELTRENIHELFTMVLQDTWLFEGTIKENIVYNRENVTDERVEEVCKEVGLDHYIKTLPHGYNSILSENDSVSAGQRQLLTIARGMIEDAPFLILDEATSNVDTRTEEMVQTAMDKLTEGKTSFIIAHRLSTIKNADLILVMQNGNITEQGNHEELMKQNGVYAELYNSQFEL